MTVISNKGIIFKSIPKGMPKVDENFELIHRTIDIENLNLGENELVLKNLYLSLDPYTRFYNLNNPALVGQIITGFGVSEVVKTNNPNYKVGDLVNSYGRIGWEEYSHVKADVTSDFIPIKKELLKGIPLSYRVSLLNVGGLTSYGSLMVVGKPKEGETIFVSTAAGSIGQIVGQIAKIKGLRVIGSTGSDEKVDFLLNELKFDAAFNYKKVNLDEALSKHCPNGIDIYYDNVGGETLEVAIDHCNKFARIVLCGMTSQYNITDPKEKYGVKNLGNLIEKSICMQGFTAGNYLGTDIQKEFEKDIFEWIKTGKIIYKENVSVGIENVPKGFIDMLNGNSIGKAIAKLADY
ncbi:hypothetical protein C1645_805398 [Glomus cerebriforme]|uniref:Enoyl reductase (ER) domain-containing protein n=1 Tax=Glomus cerebriforme TaxID=658196 RepID=A0A397SYD2_9GLOM|nr:hypothetical protein C1645_805398 [Glomus cerebriforme]